MRVMQTRHSFPLVVFWIAGLSACGTDSIEPGLTDGEPTAAPAALTEFTANFCEVFVDKAAVVGFSQVSNQFLRAYVKTLNDRLDGPIARVGFVGEQQVCISCNVGESGGPRITESIDLTATSFVGSADYFEVQLPIRAFQGSSRNVVEAVRGQFYVETEAGTRYLAKSARGRVELNTFSPQTLNLGPVVLGNILDVNTLTSLGTRGPNEAPRPLLNPDGCR